MTIPSKKIEMTDIEITSSSSSNKDLVSRKTTTTTSATSDDEKLSLLEKGSTTTTTISGPTSNNNASMKNSNDDGLSNKVGGGGSVVSAVDNTNSNKTGGKVASACLMYTFCSVAMVLVNKSLASSYNHLIDGNLNISLVVFQALVAILCVELCKHMKLVEYPNFDLRTARLWAPVNLFFCAMLFTGMASLEHNNVPMVTVFKNITNIIISAGEYICFGTKVDILTMASFGIMLMGAILAAWNDMFVSTIGLLWMLANCASAAGYVLYMKFAIKTVKMPKFGMVFYNNVLCLAFLFPVTIINGELQTFYQTSAIHTPSYLLKNTFAGCIGFFLNFASLNCVAQTGPTTYAIIGSLNKIPIAIFGYVLFDNDISSSTWFFIMFSMCGGFLYSYSKITAGRRKQRSG